MSGEYSLTFPVGSEQVVRFSENKQEFFTKKNFKELVFEALENRNFYILGVVLKADYSFSILDGAKVYECLKNREIIPDLENAEKYSIDEEYRQYLKVNPYKDNVFYYIIQKTNDVAEKFFSFVPIYKDLDQMSPFFAAPQKAQTYLRDCYPNGIQALRNENMVTKWYKKLAKEGCAEAQYSLGLRYKDGASIKQNLSLAFEYFMSAAMQGHQKAQFNLGLCYKEGVGVHLNKSQSFKWMESSANCKDGELTKPISAEIQFNLAVCYQDGSGVIKNNALAMECFMMAAIQGCEEAQFNLGLCYRNAIGVVGNKYRGFKWIKKAAEQGHKAAQYHLGLCYENDFKGIESKQLALECYRKAAEKGSAEAEYKIGLLYKNGIEGVLVADKVQAMAWFEKAASVWHLDAIFNLAVCYESGTEEIDRKQAFNYFKKAASGGHLEAHYRLALCYQNGIGTEKNDCKAIEFQRQAANKGLANAQFALAFYFQTQPDLCCNNQSLIEEYLNPLSLRWDKKGQIAKVIEELYKKAASQGHVEAHFNLARLYSQAIGFYPQVKEIEKAVFHYSRAANKGHADAQYYLARCYEKKNKALALKYYKKAAHQGHLDAKNILLYFYNKTSAPKKDETQQVDAAQIEWYMKVANDGYAPAQYALALCYRKGIGVEESFDKAKSWYEKAARRGHAAAQNAFGFCNYAIAKSDDERKLAIGWFERAAKQGNLKAQKNMEIINAFKPESKKK